MPFRPCRGGPFDLPNACVGVRDRDVGDPDVTVGRARHEVGKPAVVDVDADGLEVVVPRVAPGDETGGRERDRLTVQAAVEDDGGGDTGVVHVGETSRGVLEPREQARRVAPLQETVVDLIRVADAGRLGELLRLVLRELGLRLPDRPVLVRTRLGGLRGPPREQPVALHLRHEPIEVIEVLGLAVLAQLFLHRRADVTVGRHHDVAVVRVGGRAAGVPGINLRHLAPLSFVPSSLVPILTRHGTRCHGRGSSFLPCVAVYGTECHTPQDMAETWDLTTDFVVVGSGGGLVGALIAADQGLDVLVLEKRKLVGGSTAMSGGIVWVPNNPLMVAEGVADSYEEGMAYFDDVVGDVGPASSRERRDAFLTAGPEMLRFLQDQGVRFLRCEGYSDYYAEAAGGKARGRAVETVPYDSRDLGPWRDKLQPGFLAKARVAIHTGELGAFSLPFRSVHNFSVATR